MKGWTRIDIDGQARAGDIAEQAAHKPPASEPELAAAIIPRSPRYSIEELIVPSSTRQQIQSILNKVQYQEMLYETWNIKSIDRSGRKTAINLYGPPGTGKTMCAEGIAAAIGREVLEVDYAALESKYVGDTSKNLTAVFQVARDSHSVLFFDEADSVLGKRLTEVRQSADHSVNQTRSVLLKLLEEHNGIVVFATNLARNYDSAFARRILAHIEIPLPDLDCRRRLWTRVLLPEIPGALDISPDELAGDSEGLSGGEILNVLINAATAAVGRDGAERILTKQDVSTALQILIRSKLHVGEPPPVVPGGVGSVVTTTETIQLEDVPGMSHSEEA